MTTNILEVEFERLVEACREKRVNPPKDYNIDTLRSWLPEYLGEDPNKHKLILLNEPANYIMFYQDIPNVQWASAHKPYSEGALERAYLNTAYMLVHNATDEARKWHPIAV